MSVRTSNPASRVIDRFSAKVSETWDSYTDLAVQEATAVLMWMGAAGMDVDAALSQLTGIDNSRAQVDGAQQVIALVIALTVGSIVAAFLLPIGVEELVGVDTTNWSSGAQSLWDILDVIIILALFLFFIAVALAAANRV